MIEAGAIVLPGDRGREFDELRLVEVFAQAGKQSIGDFHWSLGHAIGIFQGEPLQRREIQVRAVVMKIGNLLGRDAGRSADGRADVDSKRTPHQGCDAELDQAF